MARKVKSIIIQAPGRDLGKIFILTEMSSTQAFKWASRALLALFHSGLTIPDEVLSAGMAGVAVVGLQAFTGLKYEEVEPLMDEMFQCIQYQPDPNNANFVRKLVEEDIEEVATHVFLRLEVFSLHTGFSIADEIAKLKKAPSAKPPSLGTPM